MISKNGSIKCDYCGKFISYIDLQEDKAYHLMKTPDSLISTEEWESCCKSCNKKGDLNND